MAKRIAACLLNVSEALDNSIVKNIAASATNDSINRQANVDHGLRCSSTVLNIFMDRDYNRSVITIAGTLPELADSVYRACQTAFDHIDLSHHIGGHPRLGAVDLVPIHPLSEDVSLQECGTIAIDLATRLASDVPGSSFFLFGDADLPQRRGLVERRKKVRWYRGKYGLDYSTLEWNVGAQPNTTYGLTGIGASPYVMNFNVTIATQDLSIGTDIASKIRATARTGLPGVQSMAFRHKGQIEIACNVESVATLNSSCDEYIYTHTEVSSLTSLVKTLACERHVHVVGTAIVGYTPHEALEQAQLALAMGQRQFWKTKTVTMM